MDNVARKVLSKVLILVLLVYQVGRGGAYQHLKFTDDWPTDFPKCNPSNSKYLSPISINTKKAVPTDTRTLLVYSYEPIQNYSLSTSYYDKRSDIGMSGLTITVEDQIFFECIYINGLGYENFQIFDKAVFFFSKTPLRPGFSFHRIDGKIYPMEIMFYFTNKQKPDSPSAAVEVLDTTQVFVMVEISKEDNQLWFPVIDAARKIKKMKPKTEELKSLANKLKEAQEELTKLEDKLTKLNSPVNSSMLQFVKEAIGEQQDEILKNKNLTVEYRQEMNETYQTMTKIVNANFKADLASEIERFNGLADTEEMQIQRLKFDIYTKTQSGRPKWEVLQLKEQLRDRELERSTFEGRRMHYLLLLAPLTKDILRWSNDIDYMADRTNLSREIIKMTQKDIGVDPAVLDLQNVAEFKKLYTEVIKLEKSIKTTQDTIKKIKDDINITSTSIGWKMKMTTFQASWLFPETGGYYAYNSSIPLPPCQRIRYTVVLKNPITISQKQLDLLSSLPTYEGYEPLDQLAVPLQDLGNRTLWYNKKWLQYQRDDGVHMKSIQRAKLRADKKKEDGSSGLSPVPLFIIGLLGLTVTVP